MVKIENAGFNEQDKKNKEITEKEKKQEIKKQIEFKNKKEKISASIDAENDMFKLKQLIDNGLISQGVVEKISNNEDINNNTIEEIFSKIDEIEGSKDVNIYLPEEYRITKDQYLKAINDDVFRLQTINKLDASLVILSKQINPDIANGLNLFSGFIMVLDKNLINIQENTIDINNSLKDIDEKKGITRSNNKSFFEKIKDFF